jgi:hypothetical protein
VTVAPGSTVGPGPGSDPGPRGDLPGDVARVRRVLTVDHHLQAAARLLDSRVWTPGRAEQAAQHLGRARWELLDVDPGAGDRVGRPVDPSGPADPHDPVDEWEHTRRARQSAELARLLTRFAGRSGLERLSAAPVDPVRLVLLDDARRLGDPLHRPLARLRRELLICPVVAYGTRPRAWVVFAARPATAVPPWDEHGRPLLSDLGLVRHTGDRSVWDAFTALVAQGLPARTAYHAARTGTPS